VDHVLSRQWNRAPEAKIAGTLRVYFLSLQSSNYRVLQKIIYRRWISWF